MHISEVQRDIQRLDVVDTREVGLPALIRFPDSEAETLLLAALRCVIYTNPLYTHKRLNP